MEFIHFLSSLPQEAVELLSGMHPAHVYITLPMGIFMATYWGMSGFFAVLDFTLERKGLLARYKRQPRLFPAGFRFHRSKYGRAAKTALRNQIFISLPLLILLYPVWQWRGMHFHAPYPGPFVIIAQFAVVILVQEICFFYAHRALHNKSLYKRIHHVHHEWISPIGVSAHHTHPAEHVLATSIPFVAGPLLVGLHWNLFLLWFVVTTAYIVKSHSGYRLPLLGSEDHDLHHKVFTRNFGIMLWFDRLHGTLARPPANKSKTDI